jgi:TnsA endonuclease N terminal/TnsA endonuclease C terminal
VAKRARNFTASTIDKRLKEGRGLGRGANYVPWLFIHDVPSKGRTTRVKGQTTGRVHHLLSDLERDTFHIYDWSESIIDIREQYPLLPLEETQAIAEACNLRHPGIRHPTKPGVQIPTVMTTDFVITIAEGLNRVDQARTVKYSHDLESLRTLEKLEIERIYWERRNIDWKIVTERQTSRVLAQNIQLLHKYTKIEDRLSLSTTMMHEIIAKLTSEVMRNTASLNDITLAFDRSHNLESGTCLTIVYHLLATRQWRIDMLTPIQPGNRLVLLNNFN